MIKLRKTSFGITAMNYLFNDVSAHFSYDFVNVVCVHWFDWQPKTDIVAALWILADWLRQHERELDLLNKRCGLT